MKLRPMNALTNAKNLVLFLFIAVNAYSNQPDSIPVTEYCVSYDKKVFRDSADIHLLLKTGFREPFIIYACPGSSEPYSDSSEYSNFVSKFLIHDDLKVESEDVYWDTTVMSVLGGSPGIITGPNCDAECKARADSAANVFMSYYSSLGVEWHLSEKVPIYAKNGKQIDFNKYYKKGEIFPVEWGIKASCGSLYNIAYSGKYNIRIIGECKEK